MSWPGVAIGIHVLGVVWWLGGLAFVTLVFLPALRADPGPDLHARLKVVERRFAPQARIALVLVGLSGAYLLWASGLWQVLDRPVFWWLDAMIAYWLLFVLMLFVVEPLGALQRLVFGGRDPMRGWRRFHALHAILLGLGVVIVVFSAAGSHGY